MGAEVDIRGIENLERLGKRLRDTGNKTLQKELFKGITRATKPIKAAAKTAAIAELPRGGGLNREFAKATYSTRSRTRGRNVGVRIVGKRKGHDIYAVDRGRLRHPVFGNRSVWVTQLIRPRILTGAMAEAAGGRMWHSPKQEIVRVIDDVARRLADGT